MPSRTAAFGRKQPRQVVSWEPNRRSPCPVLPCVRPRQESSDSEPRCPGRIWFTRMHGRSALLAAKLPAEDTLSLYFNYATRVAGQLARLVLTPVREILSSAFIERASEQLPWFAVVLLVSAAITSLVSRERRRRLGLTRFLLGYLCIAAVPLFGVIVLRSALRERLEQAGHSWWAALWLSLFSMVTFIVVAQWVVRRMPPTSEWLRDYRQAGRDIWRDRLARWFGIRSRH